MPPKSARMRSGGIRPSSSKSQAARLPPTSAASDTVFDFLAMIPSPVTFPPSPPKSARMRSGGIPPSSSKSQAACLPPVSAASDPAFDFLAMIPSPVAFPPSRQALSGAGTVASMDSLSLAQAVPRPSVDDGDDVIPSPVSLPPLHERQHASTAAHSASNISPASPPFPSQSQLATLPPHMAAGDSMISFLARMPAPTIDSPMHLNQSADNVRAFLYILCSASNGLIAQPLDVL